MTAFIAFLLLYIRYCYTSHIVFVLADDLGWADLHFTNGLSNVNTPTIQNFADKGIILDNYYVQPICTPTRSALMSGLYPIHTGLQDKVIRDSVPEALPLTLNNKNVVIMPQYLKQNAKYETHMIGKWHLGFYKRKYTPQERGFDHFYGYYTGNEEYWNHTSPCWNCGNYTAIDLGYHNLTTDVYDLNKGGIYSTNLFSQHAVQVIKQFGEDHVNTADATQLFLYLPFEAVHGAASCNPDCANPYGDLLQAPDYYINQQMQVNNTNRRIYAGMLGALDDAIKNITKALKDIGIWNDTLFIFSTDNGAPCGHFNGTAMSNYPLRGGKGTLWEGGVKGAGFVYTPLFEAFPNKYKSGYRYKGLMHVTDWYPTLAGMINANIDKLSDLDGYNMWKALINNETSTRTEILLNIDPLKNNNSGLISGKWKLLQNMNGAQWCPLYSATEHFSDGNLNNEVGVKYPLLLFDLEQDPNEHDNVANDNPDVVKQLQAKVEQYYETMLPPQNKDPDPNAQELIVSAGFWYSWQENTTIESNVIVVT
eukprot:42424_1